jgi:hypothetical protein
MLLLDGLTRDTQGLRYLCERPALGSGPLDRDIFDAVSEATQGADRGERVGGIIGDGELGLDHSRQL